jgi:hypothetical protein
MPHTAIPPIPPTLHELVADLPERREDEPRFWGGDPMDEVAYIEFIQWVLLLAGTNGPTLTHTQVDGVDIVAIGEGNAPTFRNAIVDWGNAEEQSPILQGQIRGGWIDPDCTTVGGVSWVREETRTLLLEEPGEVALEQREFSFITIDTPTWIEDSRHEYESLFHRLISPLVELQGSPSDNLSGWLDAMFAFASGKPVAYFSRYRPSGKIHRIAERHEVALTHIPLGALPEGLLARNHRFRMMCLTDAQWAHLERRLWELGQWEAARIVGEHRGD